MNFLHNWTPNPIALEFMGITIRWYSICIVLGLVLAVILMVYLARKRGIKSDDIYDLTFWVVVFGIIGARLYEVFLINWDYYQTNPLNIIKIWNGGIAIHGGIIAGVITLYFWTRHKKYSFWLWADLVVIGLTVGQIIGRFGNYFNQENFGKPTNLPWGIPIENIYRPVELLGYNFFHPAFLYESILSLISLLLLLWLWQKRFKIGIVACVYLINYGLIRIVMELVRVDITPIIFNVRLPILVSIIITVGGVVLLGTRLAKDS